MNATRKLTLLAALLCVSCSENAGAPPAGEEKQCETASRQSQVLECLHRVNDEKLWQTVSTPLAAVDQLRAAKYMFPAREDARLGPLLLNSQRHELHYDFLMEVFPGLFPGLTPKQYLELLFSPELREYHVGSVIEYRLVEGDTRMGFTVTGDPGNTGTVSCEDVRRVYAGLSLRLWVDELFAVPSSAEQLEFFDDCDVPWFIPDELEYEVYHRGVGFGTLRRYTHSGFAKAEVRAELSHQDILVLQKAPSDVQTVVSGVVTGSRQGPLSHLAVRSASRGTPNCYLKDGYELLGDWEGKLVRVECTGQELLVRAATPAEAEMFWVTLKPAPVNIPEPDANYAELVNLEALSVKTADERAQGTARFGAKGRNLAWLRQTLAPELTPRGFLVPAAHYLKFIADNRWQVELGAGPDEHSFAETLENWLQDEAFLSDGRTRRERLLALQQEFKAAPCDDELMAAVEERMIQVFGDAAVTVRFRSSSNAEDGVLFNGAGIYDSFSGCLADDLDDDELGPSRCDADETRERGVCRALTKVWASLWNPKAYDERDFYGIDQERAAMAVLVNERSQGELANMVAFSGNPLVRRDTRVLVNSQIGELPVVSPALGMWPEQVFLELTEGEVTNIERVSSSSEVPDGEPVVDDAALRLLGGIMHDLAEVYPFDTDPQEGRSFVLDTEWKVVPDGSLRVKQVRPFMK